MNLDNARNLKAELLENVMPTLTASSAIRSLGIKTQRSAAGVDALRTIALGISQHGKQHKLAIRVQRRALVNHAVVEGMRKKAKGEVDIRYVGKIAKLETPTSLQRRRRPLVIGCSIGHFRITAGTLGCFVKDRVSGTKLILSNNHVLANENAAKKGDAVIQPGDFDGGVRPGDVVGKLERFVRLKKAGTNFVDAAVATISSGITIKSKVLGSFGNLVGLGAPVVDGTLVKKVGRTTGETKGKVTAFEMDNVVVAYDIGNVRFDDQIEIEGQGLNSFSDGGDSGSLIVNNNLEAVALLFAGGDSGGSNGAGLTYANSIQKVLDALKVDLLT